MSGDCTPLASSKSVNFLFSCWTCSLTLSWGPSDKAMSIGRERDTSASVSECSRDNQGEKILHA